MTELILLGAGASVDAGVPSAYKMSKEMLQKFDNDPSAQSQGIDQALQFVMGGLLFRQGIRAENPDNGINIEELFNAVMLLGDRQTSELSPFISSWHPQLVNLESGALSSTTARTLLESIYRPVEKYIENVIREDSISGIHYSINEIEKVHSAKAFAEKFNKAVRQIMTGSQGEIFKTTAEAMTRKLVEMVWLKDVSKVAYLVPLIQYAKTTNSTFVTLNYDNTIELAGDSVGEGIDTGFNSWSRSGRFSFRQGKIPLIKLHGSIDWSLSAGQTYPEKPLPYQVIEKVEPEVDADRHFQPAVVFGGKNKLTAKGPFLSLLRAFDQQLAKSEQLTIIGYSFRDDHVNEFIMKWFNGDVDRCVRIIDPNPNSLESEFANILLHVDPEPRVQVIRKTAANGIPRLIKILR
jgi:hypothetical protein